MVEIEMEGVGKSFGGTVVFRDFSASLQPGRITAVRGANGSGKSTLLRLAAKLLSPDTGKVVARDREAGLVLEKAEFRSRLAMVTPELRFYPRLTAWENMDFLLGLRGEKLSGDSYSKLLERVGLSEKKVNGVQAGGLSTGMRQRLKLAVLLASQAEVWLLDEPGANLDLEGRSLVLREARQAADS
ncbi:MAG: ABC transporter ATP-binding protein, partial [Selenomonas sp.]|nr:ABC transporter ATP-binding protein [Selenomonas sp.]